MVPFVLLTALFAVFATRNVTALVTDSLEERVTAQLVSASQRTSDDLAKKEREHLEALRAISYTDGVAEALAAGDGGRLETLVVPLMVNSGTEHIEIYDMNGQRVLGIEQAADRSLYSLANIPGRELSQPVRDVLAKRQDARGDKWAAVAPDGGGSLETAGPVVDQDGQLVGVVVVASKLGPMLVAIKGNTVADVTLASLDGGVIGTTFDQADAAAENGFLLGGDDTTRGTVLGREFQFLRAELRVRGEPAGSVAVALPLNQVSSTSNAARAQMSVVFGVITAMVIVIGWLVARHLTGPLTRLVRAAKAVADGDLSARSNVRTSDEIGVLGASFDAMAARLEQQHLATIGALASAIDARDPYTAGHSVRVGDLSAEIGGGLGLPKPTLHHLRVGGLLHDIGKIGVRDSVLLKPGALSKEERRLIEQHPTIGLQILESAQLPPEVLAIVGGHHERLNGSGYPLGLTADEITVFPRITAVADMYDALTTDRPYRAGMTVDEALAILLKDVEQGCLDAEVVATMQRIARVWEERRRTDGVTGKAWIESLNAIRPEAA